MHVSRRGILQKAEHGSQAFAVAVYARTHGIDMIKQWNVTTKDDLTDAVYRAFSTDNGRTWSDPKILNVSGECSEGRMRSRFMPPWVDPVTDRQITLYSKGAFPDDHALNGMKHYRAYCRVSLDGGHTHISDAPIAAVGGDAVQPFEGIHVGHNCMMFGDRGCQPICIASTGELIVPVQITPQGPDGEYCNPGGGYTWHETAVLIARWRDEATLEWSISERIRIDPSLSTRGVIEPTIVALADGRILMVLRGSNQRVGGELIGVPGCKWWCVSDDAGRTWSEPQPWRYDDGSSFFSPSSCSQLLKHSSGSICWLGNICDRNPEGNLPRTPLVIGEVDQESLGLLRDSVTIVDQCGSGDSTRLQLSNFLAHEDRETGEIVVHLPRLFENGAEDPTSHTYEVRVGMPEDVCKMDEGGDHA